MKMHRRDGTLRRHDADSEHKRRNVLAFVFSLFVSVVLWLMLTLSGETTDTLRFRVVITGLPADVAFVSSPDSLVFLKIKSTGFRILAYRFGTYSREIEINASSHITKYNSKRRTRIALPLLPLLKSQELQGSKPLSFAAAEPDSIILLIEPAITLKLPAIPIVDATFATDRNIIGNWQCVPDSVEVTGAKSLVNKMKSVSTERLTITNIEGSVELAASLNTGTPLLKTAPSQVMVKATVDRFTEKTLEINLAAYKGEPGVKYMVLPAKVRVIVTVALSKYDLVTGDDIDLSLWPSPSQNLLEVRAITDLPFVRILRVDPPSVEYFKVN